MGLFDLIEKASRVVETVKAVSEEAAVDVLVVKGEVEGTIRKVKAAKDLAERGLAVKKRMDERAAKGDAPRSLEFLAEVGKIMLQRKP